MKIVVSISMVVVATFVIFKLSGISKHLRLNVSNHAFVSELFNYQLLLLGLAAIVLALTYLLNGENFIRFVSLGNISSPARAVPILGIGESESWLRVGVSMTLVITLVTSIFIYLQAKGGNVGLGTVLPYAGWIVLFAFTNSLSEEAIYRLGLVVPLFDSMSSSKIMLMSAIIFGVAHYAGMPNGITGMLMAGVLGWILTKSVIETEGVFWAWSIHFFQDVVIFWGLFLIKDSENGTQVVNGL